MEIIEKYGRAFFVEILAYGVPLKKDGYDPVSLLDEISLVVSTEADLDVEAVENRLRFYAKDGSPIVGIACETESNVLLFTMPGEEPNFEYANNILDVLFNVVKVCLDSNVFGDFQPKLNQESVHSQKPEESFECDGDFSI